MNCLGLPPPADVIEWLSHVFALGSYGFRPGFLWFSPWVPMVFAFAFAAFAFAFAAFASCLGSIAGVICVASGGLQERPAADFI